MIVSLSLFLFPSLSSQNLILLVQMVTQLMKNSAAIIAFNNAICSPPSRPFTPPPSISLFLFLSYYILSLSLYLSYTHPHKLSFLLSPSLNRKPFSIPGEQFSAKQSYATRFAVKCFCAEIFWRAELASATPAPEKSTNRTAPR